MNWDNPVTETMNLKMIGYDEEHGSGHGDGVVNDAQT